MKTLFALFLVIAPVTAAAASDFRSAGSNPSTSTFDQTILCPTAFIGGARSVTASAHRGTGRSGGSWDRPAFANVTTGQTGSQFTLLDNALAWVSAGRPKPDAAVIQSPDAGVTYPLRVWGALAWNVGLCRQSSRKLPLTTKGLSGGSAGVFDDAFECNTPGRVLVRIRATMLRTAKPTGYRQFLRITAPLVQAELAVGAESGRPLAYAQVLSSGKARLVTARGCTPNA